MMEYVWSGAPRTSTGMGDGVTLRRPHLVNGHRSSGSTWKAHNVTEMQFGGGYMAHTQPHTRMHDGGVCGVMKAACACARSRVGSREQATVPTCSSSRAFSSISFVWSTLTVRKLKSFGTENKTSEQTIHTRTQTHTRSHSTLTHSLTRITQAGAGAGARGSTLQPIANAAVYPAVAQRGVATVCVLP